MLTTRHMSTELELVRWFLLVAAAIASLLAIATALAADATKEPRLLPNDMAAIAKPIMPEVVKPFFPENPPARQLPPAEAAARLWTILEHHRGGRALEALNGWDQVGLPVETAHWREIAISTAYLRVGDQNRAIFHLEAARQLNPDNAVLAYFTALLRLEQAAAVGRLPDSMPKRDLYVSYTPWEDKALYQGLAIGDLETAIVWANEVRLDERLLAVDSLVEDIMIVPTAGDIIAALGADNFVGKAHHVLFGLQLKRGELGNAETHLDQAAATGIAVLYGYRDLAMEYLDDGRNADAVRVAEKDLQINNPWVLAFCERLTALVSGTAKTVWVW